MIFASTAQDTQEDKFSYKAHTLYTIFLSNLHVSFLKLWLVPYSCGFPKTIYFSVMCTQAMAFTSHSIAKTSIFLVHVCVVTNYGAQKSGDTFSNLCANLPLRFILRKPSGVSVFVVFSIPTQPPLFLTPAPYPFMPRLCAFLTTLAVSPPRHPSRILCLFDPPALSVTAGGGAKRVVVVTTQTLTLYQMSYQELV